MPPRGAQRRYGPTPMTAPKATRALASLLRDCRPEMLATFTPDYLVRCHNVTPAVAEKMLAEAKQQRLGL